MAATSNSFFLKHTVKLFAIVGFLALALALWLTVRLVERAMHESVIRSAELSNYALSQVFVNEVWDEVEHLFPPADATVEQIRGNPNLHILDSRFRHFGHGTDIVKIKAFNLRGLTVYSSEARQIGDDKSGNEGFRKALAGTPASELTFRGQFNSFDGELVDRNLVSSYVPVKTPAGIMGVVEVYTDRTLSVQSTDAYLRELVGLMIPIVLTVYVGLLFFVRGAEKAQSEYTRSLLEVAEASAAARRLADEANAGKTAFLSAMSHEIRTPMNGVIGMANLLLETSLDNRQRDYARNIVYSGESLLTIINDILDLSKVEAGRLEFELHPFVLSPLVNAVSSLLGFKAREKGVVIQVESQLPMQAAFVGDSTRIRQVLLNLVGNAVKFTQAGSVRIRVLGMEGGLRFEVVDTGIGMSAEVLGRLFTEYNQAEASTARTYGGTGLGLAISKRLVEGMGGTIGVNSTPGKGSTFWFELPLKEADMLPDSINTDTAQTAPQSAPVQEAAPFSPATRVLLVEDNAINQKLALVLLERLGLKADLAQNGEEAVQAVQRSRYNLVLMDMQMPVMDGLEATRAIRALGGEFASLKIVALTANAMGSDREACRAAGMDDFLSKPFSKTQLLACIERWVGTES